MWVVGPSPKLITTKLLVKKQPPQVLYEKSALNNFSKFTGKHLYWRLFFKKEYFAKFCETL